MTPDDKAAALMWAKWVLPAFPIAIGLVFLLITLAVIAAFIRDCVRTGTYSRMSGFAFLGPIFIDFGLALHDDPMPAWLYLSPWAVELAATAIAIGVRRATRAVVEPPPGPRGNP